MDDNFLYQLREQPDQGFAKNLYRKLNEGQTVPDKNVASIFKGVFVSKKLVMITSLLGILMISLVAISPVRAFVSSLIQNIAGQTFTVTTEYPGDNQPEEIIEPQIMSVNNALAIYPHEVKLPSYIPAGYMLSDNVFVYVGEASGPFANTIEFFWKSNGERSYILRINDQNKINSEVVAPASAIEEIKLDDNHSAVLIRGGWNYDLKSWDDSLGLRLKWSLNGLTYDLSGNDQNQLIEIAVSTIK